MEGKKHEPVISDEKPRYKCQTVRAQVEVVEMNKVGPFGLSLLLCETLIKKEMKRNSHKKLRYSQLINILLEVLKQM